MRRERSPLEWQVNLPFIWIDAAARDDPQKEHLVHAAILRNENQYLNSIL